jgi:hypothetical protein
MKLTLTALLALSALMMTDAHAASRRGPRAGLRQDISFTQNWSRYPAPDAIIETLQFQFPHADLKYISAACLGVTNDNQSVLGTSNPLTGVPAIRDPNSAFLVWYTGCVKEFVKAEQMSFRNQLSQTKGNDLSTVTPEYVSAELLDLCRTELTEKYGYGYGNCEWAKLDEAKRIAALSAEIERLLGPDEVVRDLGVAPSINDLAKRIDQQLADVIANKPQAFKFLDIEMTSVLPFNPVTGLSGIRFLILLNDTLKY